MFISFTAVGTCCQTQSVLSNTHASVLIVTGKMDARKFLNPPGRLLFALDLIVYRVDAFPLVSYGNAGAPAHGRDVID